MQRNAISKLERKKGTNVIFIVFWNAKRHIHQNKLQNAENNPRLEHILIVFLHQSSKFA